MPFAVLRASWPAPARSRAGSRARRGGALAVLVSVLALASPPLAGRAAAAAGCAPPAVAHRGEPAVAPENTLSSFRAALEHGARIVELDVRFTSSDVPVVLHDATVDRTTNGTGAVTYLTFTKLRTLDAGSWYSPTFAGEKVPTLYEVLSLARSYGARAIVELKVDPTSPELAKFLDRIDRLGMRGQVVVQSFRSAAIRKVRAAAPGIRTGIIDEFVYRSPSSALSYGPTYTTSYAQGTVDRVQAWDGVGLDVYVFPPNTPAQWQRYAGSALAGTITGRTGDYLRWSAAGCPAPS